MDSENQRRARRWDVLAQLQLEGEAELRRRQQASMREIAERIRSQNHTSSTGGQVPSNLLQYALRVPPAPPPLPVNPMGRAGGTLPPPRTFDNFLGPASWGSATFGPSSSSTTNPAATPMSPLLVKMMSSFYTRHAGPLPPRGGSTDDLKAIKLSPLKDGEGEGGGDFLSKKARAEAEAEAANERAKENAAARVQAGVRGRMSRRFVSDKKEAMAAEEAAEAERVDMAAARVQAGLPRPPNNKRCL